jgi:Domain of unknown function (DUF4160)
MPTISIFYGIVVQMYWREHPPAHFHAHYQGMEGLFSIETGELISGRMSVTRRRMIKAWTLRHQLELHENWERSRLRQPFNLIPGADVA